MSSSLVLLTGATGFVGSHVMEELLLRGYRVRILTRSSQSLLNFRKDVEVQVVDYLRPETLIGIGEGVDYVVHMAGVIKGKKFGVFKRGNIYTTTNLLNELKKYPIKKFVFMSSQSAAGPSVKRPLTEEDLLRPVSFYGLSKKIAEERVIKSRLPYIILRPSAVFGEGDRETFTLFKLAKMGLSLSIGNGPLFNLIYVKDLAKIVAESIGQNVKNSVYFVNNGEIYSPKKLNKILSGIIGKKHTFHLNVPKAIAPLIAFLNEYYSGILGKESMLTREKLRELKQYAWLASNERLKRDIFSSFTPSEEAFQLTFTWYKTHNWL